MRGKTFFKRTLAGFSAATALAVGFSIAGTTPAYAGTSIGSIYTTDSGPKGGKALFYHKGDTIYVCDIQADGLRAWAQLEYWDANKNRKYAYVQDADGSNGNCHSNTNFDVPEGTRVFLKVCLRDGPTGPLRYCSTGTAIA